MSKNNDSGEDTNQAEGGGSFNRNQFLSQVAGEVTKQRRESLKGKVKELLKKKEDALRAVAVIDREISDELDKFEQGL